MGKLKTPDPLRHRSGKSALLMAEQLTLQEPRRNRRAVELDEGPAGPGTDGMDGSRNELFSRARLAQNQHPRFRWARALPLLQRRLQRRTRTHNLLKIGLSSLSLRLACSMIARNRLLDGIQENLIGNRLWGK